MREEYRHVAFFWMKNLVQYWQCTLGRELSWNLLTLLTTSGLLFLEISLVAFLLQGNQASGLEALTRTFVISGVIVAVDVFLKVLLIFLCGSTFFSFHLIFTCSRYPLTLLLISPIPCSVHLLASHLCSILSLFKLVWRVNVFFIRPESYFEKKWPAKACDSMIFTVYCIVGWVNLSYFR